MTDAAPLLIDPFLRSLVANRGSDLHVKVGSPPRIRIKGALMPLDVPPLLVEQVEEMVLETMNADTKEKFLATNEADYAISVAGVGRFRANAFRSRGSAALICRLVGDRPMTLGELNLPEVIERLALEPRGLVLVTGPTGSGKQLPLTTAIPTPTGYTTMGDLKIDDWVLGRDGRPCRVTFLSPIDHAPELYRLRFSDGQAIVADRDHQWLVSTHHGRNVPRTERRCAAIKRCEHALRDAQALEVLGGAPGLPEGMTASELFQFIDERGLTTEFVSPYAVTAALKMTDCPSHEGVRVSRVEYTVDRCQPARLFAVREFLEAVAQTHRVRTRRAAARAALDAEKFPAELPAEQLGALIGTGQASVRDFAESRGVAVRLGVVEWAESRCEDRPMPVREYPVAIALKSLALRLRQRFVVAPSSEADLTRMTVGEMLAAGLRLTSGHAKFAIPLAASLDLPTAEVAVDPYVLGAWLGDGSTGGGTLTQNDAPSAEAAISDMAHLIGEITAAGYGARKSSAAVGNQITTQGLFADLRTAGVLNRKHIPMRYLRASTDQRLALLQGLMDTDGTIGERGACELSLSDRTLAADALNLIRSLGIKASITWDNPVSYVDHHGERFDAKDRHRIHFTTDMQVFRLARKAARVREQGSLRETSRWVYLTGVEPIRPCDPEYGPARCITVDSPDHTYLCGEGYLATSNTTTLGAMVDRINEVKPVHILTIEDPIEIMHTDKVASVNQRELRLDTADFKVALKAAMRQDPDVILIGEMRDPETVHAALSAAETGHFVMSTLHTTDAAETINRIIDFFPPNEQKQVRVGLAQSLKGVICQRLVPTADGAGRVCVMEILVNNNRVAEAIMDPERTHEITDLVASGKHHGMQTFDQHLVQLVLNGGVTITAAKMASSSPHDLSVALKRAGVDPVLVDAA